MFASMSSNKILANRDSMLGQEKPLVQVRRLFISGCNIYLTTIEKGACGLSLSVHYVSEVRHGIWVGCSRPLA